jgi:triosephosphate isomerase
LIKKFIIGILCTNGVKKEFTDKNFPWQDTTWKFVDSKSEVVKEAQNAPSILDFAISDYNGQDITQTVLNYDGNLFLLYIKDVNTANTATVAELKNLYDACVKAGVPFLALSASNDIETAKFNTKHGLSLPFYTIDATVCKTAMRTNPGLMQLQKGTVTGKWSYANYPVFSSLGIPSPSNQAPLFPTPAPVVTDTSSIQP